MQLGLGMEVQLGLGIEVQLSLVTWVQLVMGSRNPELYDAELAEWLEFGASPRATIALDRCARANAYLQGRDADSPDDVQAVLLDCLKHRLILSFEAEASGITRSQVINRLLETVPVG